MRLTREFKETVHARIRQDRKYRKELLREGVASLLAEDLDTGVDCNPMRDLPIVFTLQPGELNARATQLLPGVVASARARHATENGFRFEFQPDGELLASIVRMIDAERQCCQFLRFQLTIEAAGGPVVLEVTGPPGSREFLDAMIDPA
jgi:hypothetical protein